MSKIDELKPLADRFARLWGYDWRSCYAFVDGEAIYIKETTDSDGFEIRTSVWALDLNKEELELTEEVHLLTEDDLRSDEHPRTCHDYAPGEFVDEDQWRLPSLFSQTGSELNGVPDEILIKAVEIYYSEKGDLSCDYFWNGDDQFDYLIPQEFNKTVREVLDRLCSKEAIRLREQDLDYQLKIRKYDLSLLTEPPISIKAGQKASGLQSILGNGIAILTGMIINSDYSARSLIRVSEFREWLVSVRGEGHTVFPVEGVFCGVETSECVFAICDISRAEAESVAVSTNIETGLFIGSDCVPQIISKL